MIKINEAELTSIVGGAEIGLVMVKGEAEPLVALNAKATAGVLGAFSNAAQSSGTQENNIAGVTVNGYFIPG